jgi:hypothetical protein
MHIYSNDETPQSVIELPERTLWLAVIERAIKDYCFFFERLQRYEYHNNHRDIDRFQYNPKSKTHGNAIAEFDRLRWFLFDLEPVEFNLTYLSLMLYDGDGFACQTRQAATKHFKRHLEEIKQKGIFPHIVAHIIKNIPVDEIQLSEETSRLRFIRYRVTAQS